MLGIRYLKAKKKFSFVSVITVICILGILVGDMVMITVLSVMNGFQDDIRDKIEEFVPTYNRLDKKEELIEKEIAISQA